jgi:hypothetical protein
VHHSLDLPVLTRIAMSDVALSRVFARSAKILLERLGEGAQCLRPKRSASFSLKALEIGYFKPIPPLIVSQYTRYRWSNDDEPPNIYIYLFELI